MVSSLLYAGGWQLLEWIAAHGRNRRGYHGQIGDRPPKPLPELVSRSQSVYTTAFAESRDLKSSGATGGERKSTSNEWWRETKERDAGTEDTRTR
jgi:hypothetical protein